MINKIIKQLLKIPYNKVLRPYLPSKVAVYNGVPVKEAPFLDQTVQFPDYEGALIESIRQYAERGQTIVQVGGGRGVSAVAAARAVGPNGQVIVYEGGSDYVERIQDTLALNDISDRVDVQNIIVGENRDVWGDTTEVEIIDPRDLPKCDLLVLDCEGAEQMILPRFECEPVTLIVESHGELESPTKDVQQKIEERGYRVEQVVQEVPEKDVCVVTATRTSEQ